MKGAHLIAFAVAAALAACPAVAWAGELEEVRAEIEQKTGELELLMEGIEAEKDRIAEIEQNKAELLADLEEKQLEHARLSNDAAALACVMYKDNEDFNVFVLLDQSGSLDEFLYRLEMRERVLSASSDMLEELERVQAEIDGAYRQASADADEQRSLLADLKGKRKEMEDLIADLRKREKDLDVEQKIALAQAAAEAHKVMDTFDTGLIEEHSNDLPADGSKPDDAGWRTGTASAYGGASDKMTPNPGITATGTRCDDWSVGVAVPMVWGPAKYYGRYVEISYDGKSVIAPIVDCGGMGNGSRALDLQPGVFKAFGANTCGEWGLREVRYRFL